MRGATWYRFRNRVQSNMLLVPALYAVMALVLGWVLPRWDRNNPLDLGLNADSMSTALNAIATGMIAFTGLVFSGVMLVVQFGSSTFSTRLMRWFWRSMIVKNALGAFIATFLFSLVALANVDSRSTSFVPTRSFLFAMLLVLFSVAMFLALLDRLASLLRVARVSMELGRQTRHVIDEMYPDAYDEAGLQDPHHGLPDEEPAGTIFHDDDAGSIMAIDRNGLVRFAGKHDLIVELVPTVGDHVSRDAPLFRVFGAYKPDYERRLRRGVVIGEERTVDGDPSFGFRLLVDIALKALSPAVNDPTTAVQILDRLEDLLLFASGRQLQRRGEVDDRGKMRLSYRTPTWDDLLRLALEEIRVYGASAPQVTRRSEAVLDALMAGAPEARQSSIEAFRSRLERTIAGAVPEGEGRRFARTPDRQGIGPAPRAHA